MKKKGKKDQQEHLVRPETIRRLAELTGAGEAAIRRRLNVERTFTEAEPNPDEEIVVVGSVLPALAGSRRETCGRCGGPCWLVDSPVPNASFLCARCYVRDNPDMSWMLGPELH